MHLLEGYRQRRRERLRRLYERHKNIHRLLRKHGEDILQSENFRSTRAHIQHGTMTVHNHCMDVARYSLLLNKKLGIGCNKHDLIRGALLHDYFLLTGMIRNIWPTDSVCTAFIIRLRRFITRKKSISSMTYSGKSLRSICGRCP